MEDKRICIGISGCTNAGKTTISTDLKGYFPGTVTISQDHYFRPDDSPEHIVIPELNHKNWERLEAVDWESMMDFIKSVMRSTKLTEYSLLIVEGHLIFNHPELRNIFDKMYFLTLNKEECLNRRKNRVYDPPDIPGYFELCVWPMYLSNLEDVKENCPNVMYVDGCMNPKNILETIMVDIENTYFPDDFK